MFKVSVVIPTYNERESIVLLLPLVDTALSAYPHEILVVDDDSPDGTGEAVIIAAKDIPAVRLIPKPHREGIGAALRYGYARATGDVILSMDADLSFAPTDIPRLLTQIEEGFDLVLGSRHCEGGRYETPRFAIFLKYAASACGSAAARALSGVAVRDYTANFRAIRVSTWKKITTQENTNSLLMEMIFRISAAGGRIKEVPVSFVDRRHGHTKLNLWSEAPKFLASLLRQSFQLRVQGRP